MNVVSNVSSIVKNYELNSKKEIFNAYDVLNANIEAIGGEQKIKDDKTSYREASIKIDDAEYEAYFWQTKPGKSRRDVYSGEYLLYSSGDTGVNIWSLDKQTNTLNSYIDAGTKDRNFRDSFDNFDYLDKNNNNFKVDDEGYETIDGVKHYVIKISNKYTKEEVFQYINTDTLMLSKQKNVTDKSTIEKSFSDFKDVSGVLKPFTEITENLETNVKQELTIKKFKRNIVIHKDIYATPEKNIMGNYDFKM